MRNPAPQISEELLRYLRELYPDVSPDLDHTADQIRFRSGQVSVVRHLTSIHATQQKDIRQT